MKQKLPPEFTGFHEIKFDFQIKTFLKFLVVLLDLSFKAGIKKEDFFETLLVEPM